MFTLHPQLEKDCIQIGAFSLCRVLLMNDRHYPWFILVPQRPDLRELHDLSAQDLSQFIDESMFVSRELSRAFQADKMNIATLGNMVPQLHIHHIVRYENDPAWPAPVWGKLPARPYEPRERDDTIRRAVECFSLRADFTVAQHA